MQWERLVEILSAARPYIPVNVWIEDTATAGTAVLRLVDQDPATVRMWFAVDNDEFVVELAKTDLQRIDPRRPTHAVGAARLVIRAPSG